MGRVAGTAVGERGGIDAFAAVPRYVGVTTVTMMPAATARLAYSRGRSFKWSS
jgi:hypothetical protein